jgi:nicotinamide riboside transporter PnuC
MFGIATVLLRLFGVGAQGRLRFIMAAGTVIGLACIVLGVSRGDTTEVVVGVAALVWSVVFWPWLLRTGRRRGTI